MTYSIYIQDQLAILQLWAGCHQGAKKLHFTACHSGKQQLACTSPQVISTSPKPFLINRIDYNPSVNYLNFPPKKHFPVGHVKKKSLARQQNPLALGYQTRLSLHAVSQSLSECEAEVDTIKLPSFFYKCKILLKKKIYLHKNNMIYIIKKEGLYQNEVHSSLDCDCEIGYYCVPFSCGCRCSVCLYYGLHLHVLNNQQKSDYRTSSTCIWWVLP